MNVNINNNSYQIIAGNINQKYNGYKRLVTSNENTYIKVLDVFNMDNIIGKFLRNVNGFFVIFDKASDAYSILFANMETYGEFIRYLIQEKAIEVVK